MEQDMRDIERELLVERQELTGNLRELGDQARALTDWRRYYRSHTGTVLAVTCGTGMLLGLMRPVRSSSSSSSWARDRSGSSPDSWEPFPAMEPPPRRRESNFGFRGLRNLSEGTRAGRQVTDTAHGILDALVGIVSSKAVQFVAQLIPGFRDEYEARRGSRSSRMAESKL